MTVVPHDCEWLLWRQGDQPVGYVHTCWCGRAWEMAPVEPLTLLRRQFVDWRPASTSDPKFWIAASTSEQPTRPEVPESVYVTGIVVSLGVMALGILFAFLLNRTAWWWVPVPAAAAALWLAFRLAKRRQ